MDDLFGDLPPPSSSPPAPPSTTSGSSKPSSLKPASVGHGGSASKRPLGMAGLLSASVQKKHATGAAPSSLFDDLPPPSSSPSAPTEPTYPGLLLATGAASKDKDRAPGESEGKQAAAAPADSNPNARGVKEDEAEPGSSNKEEGQQQWRVGVEAAVYGSKGRRLTMEGERPGDMSHGMLLLL